MIRLFKRKNITILDKSWKPIIESLNLKIIPRYGEYVFLEETKKYYKVLNVIYYLNKNQGIFVIVEEFGEEIPNK